MKVRSQEVVSAFGPQPSAFWVRAGLGLLLLYAVPSGAFAAEPARVLMIFREASHVPANRMIEQAVRETLSEAGAEGIEIYTEYLDTGRFADASHYRSFREYLREKYARQRPDVLVLILTPAFDLAGVGPAELLPGVPVVFIAVNATELPAQSLGANVTGIVARLDVRGTLDSIFRLQPQTQRVVLIGVGSDAMMPVDRVQEATQAYVDRAQFEVWADRSITDMRSAVAALSAHCVVLYAGMFRDVENRAFVPAEVLQSLVENASVPTYVYVDSQIGSGAVGGSVVQYDKLGVWAGEAARRILNGLPAADQPITVLSDGTPLFDWRALRRWGIRESRLPPGSVIKFRQPTFWELYQGWIVGVALFCAVQTALIIGLFVNRARLRDEEAVATLIADLSARFINLPADQVDAAIEDAQRRVCECLDLDMSTLWQLPADRPGTLLMTHYHAPADFPPPKAMDASEVSPWCLERVRNHETTVVSRLTETPAAAARDRQLWRHYGVKSVLTLPLFTGNGAAFGALNFNLIREEREWSPALVNRLRLVAQVFANALARRRTEQALRESEERLALAAATAGVGLWVLNATGTNFWVNAEIMTIFGLSPADELAVDRFIAVVYSEDRQLIREVLARAVNSADMSVVEYRIVRPDGRVRWVSSSGRVCAGGFEKAGRLMGTTVDITEHKRMEEALRESESRLASAVDVAGLGFYELAGGESVSFLDSRARVLIGIPADQDQGAPALQFWLGHLHPEDRPRIVDVHQQMYKGMLDQSTVEYRYLHPQRGLIWIQHLGRITDRDAAGREVRAVGVLRDITERRRIEETLADQLRFERLLADASTRFVSLSSHELDREIKWVFEQVLDFFHADRCTLWRISFEKSMVKTIGLIREESVQSLPSDFDMAGLLPWSLGTLVARREPLVVNSLDELPPEARVDRKSYQGLGIRSILLIPVFTGDPLAFVISISSVKRERIWPEHSIPRLRLLTEALANALMRKRAEEEIRESCEAFQSLAGRLLSAQEEERRRLARELHDDLSQRLAIVSIGIGKLEQLSGLLPDQVMVQLKGIRERVIDLSSDVHDISRQLHPSIIEDLGLNRAIQSECANFTQREGIRVHYRSKDVPAAIPIDTAVCLFRVVQEGMRNIAKHAKVNEADVSLTGADDRIILTIQDAGVGFDVARPAGRPVLGLTSMKERVHLIRGEFLIESTPGKGTTIKVVAPLSEGQK